MTPTATCGGPTTSGSTPPSDTGVRKNSPNKDSSSKRPSNTPLPIQLDSTRLPAESFGLTPVVPPKRNRTAPWDCDREAYRGRNMVERVFNRMKHYRKAATRYDRLDETFLADLRLILISIYLKNTAKNQLV